MTQLYALNLQPYPVNHWLDLLPTLPEDRQQQVLSCRHEEDLARTAGAGWLLQYALERSGIPASAQHFRKNQFGKPFLSDRPEVHFSLSHSGSWAVCAVSDHPVGVDAELPRCTMAMARRHFHPEELAQLDALSPHDQADALNRLWTAKEAFLKALGCGLVIPLSSFTVHLTPDSAFLDQSYTSLPYVLHEYQPDLCRICLCTVDQRPELQIVAP